MTAPSSETARLEQLAARQQPVAFAKPARLPIWRVLLAVLAAWIIVEAVFAAIDLSRFAAGLPVLAPQDSWNRMIVPGDDVLYRMRPGDYPDFGFQINSMGYRGPGWSPKQPGTIRFLALGDSTVFGHGVPFDQAWTELAERQLARRAGRPVEVLNMGQIGASSEHNKTELLRIGDELEPDGLIIGAGAWNDFTILHEDPAIDEREAVLRHHFHRQIESAESPLLWSGVFRRISKWNWKRIDRRNAELNDLWQREGKFRIDAVAVPRRVPPEHFRQNLQIMCAWANERNIPVFFLTPRLRPDDGAQRWNEEAFPIIRLYDRIIREVAADCSGIVIPSREYLTKLLETAPAGDIWWDWVHLTPLGNRAVAEVVTETIWSNWKELQEAGSQ